MVILLAHFGFCNHWWKPQR